MDVTIVFVVWRNGKSGLNSRVVGVFSIDK